MGVQVAVSKLLWELRAAILQQAIPLSFILFVCVKFPLCPHPFSHPVASSFVHPSIPYFVSADFIPALAFAIVVAILRAAESPRPLPPPRSSAPVDGELPVAGLLLLLPRPAFQKKKTLNTQPDSLSSCSSPFLLRENGSEKDTSREKRGEERNGVLGRGLGSERDVC